MAKMSIILFGKGSKHERGIGEWCRKARDYLANAPSSEVYAGQSMYSYVLTRNESAGQTSTKHSMSREKEPWARERTVVTHPVVGGFQKHNPVYTN